MEKKMSRSQVGAVVLFTVLLLVVWGVNGQTSSRLKTFDLNVPMLDEFVTCLSLAEAVRVADIVANMDDEDDVAPLAKYMETKPKCRTITYTVTYRKLVYETFDKKKETVRVYEADVGGRMVWVILRGWVHNTI